MNTRSDYWAQKINEAIKLFESGLPKLTIAKRLGSSEKEIKYIRSQLQKYNRRQEHKGLAEECDKVGIDLNSVGNYWYKGKNYSIHAKPERRTYEQLRDEIVEAMNQHSPQYPAIERRPSKDGHLLVIDPADIHIGKLASAFETSNAYNIEIAKKRVLDGVQGILDKTSGFNIDKILLIIGNDILHIDTPKRTTTSGTPQDTDGMWYEGFLEAKQLYVKVIEMLLPLADIHVVFNPSNHDYTNGFFLADAISSWFRLSPNITFDCSISHRKYFSYGSNLIGSTHGDGAKPSDLPLLMAQEAKEAWATTKHRYVYTHHVHHKIAKDYIGVAVESLRTPSGTDSWSHRNGYEHCPKAVEGFLHHKEHGQIARISHFF